MKCFNHSDVDAVAICKNCSKGLCMVCAVEVGNGIACKDKCEQDVQAINEMIKRGVKSQKIIQSNSLRSHYISSLFLLLCGCVSIGYGIYSVLVEGMTGMLIYAGGTGIIFLVTSAMYFALGKKASRIYDNNS